MHYFDTSFLAPLFLVEDKSHYVREIIHSVKDDRTVSHWLRVEFSSMIARCLRMKVFNKTQAASIMDNFETLLTNSFHILIPTVADYDLANSLLQHFHTGLRADDALHLAIAQNHGAKKLYTLDHGLEKAAKKLTSLQVIA
jgi:predicted nucleic acid-binding protein